MHHLWSLLSALTLPLWQERLTGFLHTISDCLSLLTVIDETGVLGETAAAENVSPAQEGWASWAWSMVAVGEGVEEEGEEEGGSEEPPEKPAPPIFDISFYNKTASLVIKVLNFRALISNCS